MSIWALLASDVTFQFLVHGHGTVRIAPADVLDCGSQNHHHVQKMQILQARSLKASTAQSTATFEEKHKQGTDRDLRTDYTFVSPHFAVVGASTDVAATESDHQTV